MATGGLCSAVGAKDRTTATRVGQAGRVSRRLLLKPAWRLDGPGLRARRRPRTPREAPAHPEEAQLHPPLHLMLVHLSLSRMSA